MNLAKMQIPLSGVIRIIIPILFKFVWRQSGFAFFGALTSVGALFYFWEERKMYDAVSDVATPSKSMSIFGSILVPSIILSVILVCVFIKLYRNHKAKVNAGKCKKLNLVFKILCFLSGVLNLSIISLISGEFFSGKKGFLILLLLMIPSIVTQCLYFIPYLVANSKGHLQETAIFVLNLFAGWTIIAWIIALVWACTESKNRPLTEAKPSNSDADELKKYKELLDQNVITQEEFENKKKQLLGL